MADDRPGGNVAVAEIPFELKIFPVGIEGAQTIKRNSQRRVSGQRGSYNHSNGILTNVPTREGYR